MIDLNIPIAFAAGVVSFLAPCVIPLLPAYIGYVTGVSVKELQEKGYQPYRKKMLVTSVLYVLGFSLVFVLLGTAAAGFGSLLREYDYVIQRLGGLIILILGLQFAGSLRLPYLSQTKQFRVPKWTEKLGYVRSFFIGIVFATAWTPCVGAILGSILSIAVTTGTVVEGATLLFVYSLGISLPFLLVSLTLASAPKYLKAITKYIDPITKVSGIVLAVIGLLLLTGTYGYLNSYVGRFMFAIGWTEFIAGRV